MFRIVAPYLWLILLIITVAACSGGDDETETANPTPELAVVVFATEDPAATEPATTPTIVAIPRTVEPTPAATVGVGISQAPPSADNDDAADDVQLTSSVIIAPENRPPDVNPLTGQKVDDLTLLERRPLMVRIGNDPAARPQVALNEADIIYEEIVEWWVTRLTAIYLSQDPETIGPVRSARLINAQLVPQYQGALANSGGSDGVRWELSQTDLINLDEYFVPGPYFYRPNEGWQTRLAINAKDAREYMKDEGLESNLNLRGFYFSDLPDLSSLPQDVVDAGIIGEAEKVVIPYPGQAADTRWEYDANSGHYLRFITGDPMLEANGEQVTASNVIIYFAEHEPTDIVEDSNGATSIRIIVNGFGPAWLLRDGKIAKGNWETDGSETPKFTFSDGQPMPLKPGNTWVEVVPVEYTIDIDNTTHSLTGGAEPAPAETPTPEAAAEPTTKPAATLTPIGSRATVTPASN